MPFPIADHFCGHHLISRKSMGAFWATRVGFEPQPAFFHKNNPTWVDFLSVVSAVAAHGWACGWVNMEWSLTLVRATSMLAWVTRLLALPVLPCSQMSPYGFASPGLSGCQCKVLNTCFTEPLSSWIWHLWVVCLCRHDLCGLLGRDESGSPREARLQQLHAPGPTSSGAEQVFPVGTLTQTHTDTLKT